MGTPRPGGEAGRRAWKHRKASPNEFEVLLVWSSTRGWEGEISSFLEFCFDFLSVQEVVEKPGGLPGFRFLGRGVLFSLTAISENRRLSCFHRRREVRLAATVPGAWSPHPLSGRLYGFPAFPAPTRAHLDTRTPPVP